MATRAKKNSRSSAQKRRNAVLTALLLGAVAIAFYVVAMLLH